MRGCERQGVDDLGKMGERSRAGLRKGGSHRALAGRGRCRGQDRNRSVAGTKVGHRISKQLHHRVPGEYGDEVLFRLLCMGVFDWQDEDHRTNASTQAMRHSTAMVHRVIEWIKRVEMTVSRLLISAC